MTIITKLTQASRGMAVALACALALPVAAQDIVKVERSPVGQFEALFIGMEQGYFAEQNIELDIAIGASPDGAIAQLMNGDRHVAMTGAVPLTAAVANGLPIVAVVNAQDQNPIATYGLMVPGDSDIQSIADLKGKKIGAPGPAVNWLAGTGAVGVSGNLTTYYNEIKTGVYDGVIVFATAALPGKLYEVAPYVTKVGFGAQYAGAMAANKDWYDEQPEAVQKALKAGGEAFKAAYLADLGAAVEAGLKAMSEQGATITEVDDEFRQKWAAGMDNVAQTWAKQVDGEGKAGTEILKAYMDAIRAAGGKPVRDWDQE